MPRPGAAVLAALAVLGLLDGCVDAHVDRLADHPAPDAGAVLRRRESYVQGVSQLDVLFVIDSTSGMAPAQQALAAAVGLFLDRLRAARVDLRLGVISADLGIASYSGPGCTIHDGDGAVLRNEPRVPGCAAPPDRFITAQNVADPRAAFACIAALGEGGCGFERPLDATLRALTPGPLQPAANKGFLRDGAALLVVWVTNEDDCSAKDPRLYDPDSATVGPWTSYRCFTQGVSCKTKAADGTLEGCAASDGPYALPVKTAAAQLRALRQPGLTMVLVVAGPATPVRVSGTGASAKVEPSCTGGGLSARPAIRLREVAAELGADGAAVSICDPALGQRLAEVAGTLKTTDRYCLQHRLLDPARPRCTVDVAVPSGPSWTVPPSGAGVPGFHLAHPGASCPNGALVFDEQAQPPLGAHVGIACDTTP